MSKTTESTEFTEMNKINKKLELKKPINCKVKMYFINNFLEFKELNNISLCSLCLCGKIFSLGVKTYEN